MTDEVESESGTRAVDPRKPYALELYEMKDEKGDFISVSRICAELGIQPPQLYKWLAEDNIELRSKRTIGVEDAGGIPMGKPALQRFHGSKIMSRYTPELCQEVARLYKEEGIPANKIGIMRNIPYAHVLRILRSSDVNVFVGRASDRQWKKIKKDVLDDLRNPDMTIDDICVKHAVNKGVVLRIARGEPEFHVANIIAKLGRDVRTVALVEEVLRRIRDEIGVPNKRVAPQQMDMFDEFDELAMRVASEEAFEKRIKGGMS